MEADGLLGDLARLTPERVTAPRLSISTEHRPCRFRAAEEGTIPVAECPRAAEPGTRRSGRLLKLSTQATLAANAGTIDPDTLRAIALLSLVASGKEGNSLRQSIINLQTAARLASDSAPVLADLAAVHLVRAERTQDARELFEAIEAAERAVKADPRNRAARFNLALALDWAALDGEAAGAWKEYLKVDSLSGWAEEARARARELAAVPPPPARPELGATEREIVAYVERDAQDARLWAWDHILGDWGSAVLRRNGARADTLLSLAEGVGAALVRRGGDATLADAVQAIRAHADDAQATDVLARAHRDYADGRGTFAQLEFETADTAFARVLAARPPSAPLVDWALMFHASALVLLGAHEEGEDLLRPLAERADSSLRHPALAGRVRWALSTALLRQGFREQALAEAQSAARLLERAGEREHVGGARYLLAEAEFNLGTTAAAYASLHQGLVLLRPYRRSTWLGNLLSVAAGRVEADGLKRAALRLQRERVAVAERTGNPTFVAEAHLDRARFFTAAGNLAQAEREIEAGERLVRGLRAGRTRDWLRTDLRLARATALSRTDRARAAAVLDTVVADSSGSRTALRRLRALLARAEVRLALNDLQGATADLDHATTLLARESSAVTRASLRASLSDAARSVFDRIVLLKLQAGDTTAALAHLDQGRTSFVGRGVVTAGPLKRGWRLPDRTVGVAHALIGDTLLIFTVAGAEVKLSRRTVDAAALLQTAERLRTSLEEKPRQDVEPELAALYDWLIRPVQARLGTEETPLVLITDGELAGLPFSALYDSVSVRRRHLVEDHPLAFAGSLRDAERGRGRKVAPAERVLLVADPAFDDDAYPGLDRLRGARAEVDAIAAFYPAPTVLADTAAGRTAFTRSLGSAEVVHFAGHAVLDDARPERSYLVLARERGARSPGRLTAAEIDTLELGRVRLVVLSACETLRSPGGKAGGFAGFAAALLGSGTDGVVGSLWRVDDRLTAPLMTAFHRAYRASGDGPRALRQAQLRMLRSPNLERRAPAAWAGFRYAGN